MAETATELLVIDKAYALVLWTTNHVSRFPRVHKFTLGERLVKQVYTILEGLLRAKYTRDRAALLRGVNLELEILRFQFRMAGDLKCLALESFGHAARTVNEIGQMVGGWSKKSATR